MSQPPERFYDVLTLDGPDTWSSRRLEGVLRRVGKKEAVPFCFILYMNWKDGRPKGWGPARGTPADARLYVLIERPTGIRRAEAEVWLRFILEAGKEMGKFLSPERCEAIREELELQGLDRVTQSIQGGQRALFGEKGKRLFDVFEVEPRRKDRAAMRRFDSKGRDFLVVLREAVQPPRVALPDATVEAGEPSLRAKLPSPGRIGRATSRRRPNMRLTLDSARDCRNGAIDVDVSATNLNAHDPNAFENFRLVVDGRRLDGSGTVMRQKNQMDDFLFQETTLPVGPRETVRATVRFEIPGNVSFKRNAPVELRAVDLDGVPVRVVTRLSVSPDDSAALPPGMPAVEPNARARKR